MATTPPHYTQLGGATDSTHPPKSTITRKNNSNELAFKEKKDGFVDYDKGQHEVSTRIAGLRKEDIPARYRLRVAGNRFQKDWTVSEVVDSVLSLTLRDDVEGLLNRWIGRFARKNFPFLIRVLQFSSRFGASNSILA
jgi:hypothetical protein